MTRVKICGLARVEDAEWALELGADALGFIFEPSSPRYVGRQDWVKDFVRHAGPYAATVGVYGPLPAFLADPCDLLQFAEGCYLAPDRKVVRAVRLKADDAEQAERAVRSALKGCERPTAVLLDAYEAGAYGGTGKRVDWELASEMVRRLDLPVVLAGGLTPDNVAEAVRAVRPYAVDVSSGTEASPGVKDPIKVRDFIAAARSATGR